MRVKYLFLAVITFFLGVALAPPASAAGVGGYFGVAAGQTDADLGVSDFDDGSITSGSVDDTDTGTKLFGGYRYTENVAIEGGSLISARLHSLVSLTGSGFCMARGLPL